MAQSRYQVQLFDGSVAPLTLNGLALASSIRQTIRVATLADLPYSDTNFLPGDLAWVDNVGETVNRANLHRWNGQRWVPEWLNVELSLSAGWTLQPGSTARIDWTGRVTMSYKMSRSTDINWGASPGNIPAKYAPPEFEVLMPCSIDGLPGSGVRFTATAGFQPGGAMNFAPGNPGGFPTGGRDAFVNVNYIVPSYSSRATD